MKTYTIIGDVNGELIVNGSQRPARVEELLQYCS